MKFLLKNKLILVALLLAFGSTSSCSLIQGINIITKKDQPKTQQFLQGSEDIPVMAEMTKVPDDQPLGFDTPSGSIISSSYFTNLSMEQIASFYNQALPQMGWRATQKVKNALNFQREKQNLEIEFVQKSPANIVRFLVLNQV